MADLRSTGGSRPTASGNKSPTGRDNEANLSISTGNSAFGSAPRGVRSTRTPVVPKDTGAHRSQTIPASSTDHQTRKTPATTATLPPPKTDQKSRTPSNTSPQSSSQRPEVSNSRNLLAGTDYRIEPLSGEQKDGLWLSPPAPSMPVADFRQSGSSFQTEPSSYYSADDNAVASGPPPPMPQPQTHDSRYESLWQATQAPSIPVPSPASPTMPSPYGEGERSSGYTQTSEDDPHARNTPHIYDGPSSQHDPRDLYNSSWLAAPSPGMPVPSVASRTARPTGEGIPEINNRPSYRVENSSGEANTGDNINIPSTAPLRIHHHFHTRPTATTPVSSTSPSAASRPAPQSTVSQDNSGNASRIQAGQPTASNLAGQTGSAGSRPTGATSVQRADFVQPVDATLKPQAERPTAAQPRPTASNPSATSQRPTPILQNSSRFDSTAPSQSKPTGTATTAASGPSAKPTSIYAQYNANRLDSQTQGNGAARPSAHTTPSTSRPDARPTAQAHATPSSTATQKPLPIQNQSSSHYSESNQPTRPAGAGPSAFSASAPPKPSQAQNQQQSTYNSTTHNGSPHVAEASRPQTVSAPQPQPKPPLTSANSKLKKKGETASQAADATASIPTRPHLRGDPTQMDTEYVNMMLALDAIPTLHNILAGFFNWILLAGFILFPGTFTSLQTLAPTVPGGQVSQKLIHSITQLPLFIVAWVCCAIGAGGMLWLWWRWRKNYLWGLNKIFLPGFTNSLAGLVSTLASIYGAQHGGFSTASKSTLIVTAASTGVFLILTAFYTFWLVRRVKARHDRQVGKERAGKYGEGVVDLSKRKP